MGRSRKSGNSADLFIEGSGQLRLVEKSAEQEVLEKSKVECLGLTFESEEARRTYFAGRLRSFLNDPATKMIDGFPHGSVEDILNLSDPPYYTACPNPFVPEFLQSALSKNSRSGTYFKEPFVADVSEGKNDAIYNLHSYHTKVPHKAIMRYMLHYTEPGDVVFDGFSGTGMTGVAAALCDELGSERTLPKSEGRSGFRNAILCDLAPVCSFIAYNILQSLNRARFIAACKDVVDQTENDLEGLYETNHNGWKVRDRKTVKHKSHAHSGSKTGTIDFTLYSDVVSCPECAKEATYYSIAVDEMADSFRKDLLCPSCGAAVPENKWLTTYETVFDPLLDTAVQRAKIEPVLINYTVDGKRFEKLPDNDDRAKADDAVRALRELGLPLVKLIPGKETQRNAPRGINYLHQFFTEREHAYLSRLIQHARQIPDRRLALAVLFAITATMPYASRMRRFRADRKGGGPLSGTLYVGSLITPPHVGKSFMRNAETIADGLAKPIDPSHRVLVTTQSATSLHQIPDGSIDYIFTDPPFGHNFDYSELNFFWEAVLRVTTNQKEEAIVSATQTKSVDDYRHLMTEAFGEFFRILRPGRWMTVEFSNTMAGVWNAIQTALQQAGFVVASVSALDKKQMSFKAVMTPTAVKQDLVISAYKPNGGLEERFAKAPSVPERVWDFVGNHLSHLPRPKLHEGHLQFVSERDPRILFDRMVAWFVQHRCNVPISSKEFQEGLLQRFIERDGMIFLNNEVQEYDKARSHSTSPPQMSLFVDDERSAIAWLQQYLRVRPSKFQDLNPEFMKQLNVGWKKHETAPELSLLLSQNFLMFSGNTEVPSQIHSYLSSNFKEMRGLSKSDPALTAKAADRWYVPDPSKQIDIESLREKSLLREFEEYKNSKERKLKVFRTEAVRVGFKSSYELQDYKTIVSVAAKLPDNVVQEDDTLLMYYDVASMRLGSD